MKSSLNPINRSQSLNALKIARHQPLETLAQKNLVSLRPPNETLLIDRPMRIVLPNFFNIPRFIDRGIDFRTNSLGNHQGPDPFFVLKQEKGLKKKLKDISILAQGMKRAKNIREESRYYFIQGVILHNSGAFEKSIEMFEKFLKIVLFIKDDKSVELALNSIAVGYMYLNKPEQALQYHQKQQSLNQNAQNFVGQVNMALCFEMMKNQNTAYEIYLDLFQNLPPESVKKEEFLKTLIQRTHPEGAESYFLTQNKTKVMVLPQKGSTLPIKGKQRYMYSKLSGHSPKHNGIVQDYDRPFIKRKEQNQKINFMIYNAEESLDGYLKDVKSSFISQQ